MRRRVAMRPLAISDGPGGNRLTGWRARRRRGRVGFRSVLARYELHVQHADLEAIGEVLRVALECEARLLRGVVVGIARGEIAEQPGHRTGAKDRNIPLVLKRIATAPRGRDRERADHHTDRELAPVIAVLALERRGASSRSVW